MVKLVRKLEEIRYINLSRFILKAGSLHFRSSFLLLSNDERSP